ncbi:hypothetical protein MtrunA17_Chr2g0283331 [Medicago truncatula]|uniref:Transmembrane protein n=1 Tax=Medicago truncatula TaxID=3880 RepID=A0A396J5W6_MEDTR|nr:hypothetical protein MtrunA17_Chr2g0283331 [Medicago truncatula]
MVSGPPDHSTCNLVCIVSRTRLTKVCLLFPCCFGVWALLPCSRRWILRLGYAQLGLVRNWYLWQCL